MIIATLKPALNLKTRFANIAGGFKKATTDIGRSTKILLKKTKVKGESIRLNSILSKKREEGIRRNEKESELEASKIGSGIKAAGRPIIDLGKDLLGRIMDAVGSFILGWLVYNLPTIMSMAQNLIIRLQRAGQIISGFFGNVLKIFTGTIKIAGALLTNLVTLDIFDTNKRVQNAFSDLYNTFGDMKSQIEEGMGLVTKPLGELPGEELVPPTGTDYTTTPGGGTITGISKTIAKAETGGRYDAYAGDGGKGDPSITTMTLAQIRRKYGDYSTAVGAYQFMPGTAIGLAKQMGVDPNRAVFTPEFQDKLNQFHLKKMGYDDFKSGKISEKEFGTRIAQQYRALPDPRTGRTYADQYAKSNRATITLEEFNSALRSEKTQTSAPASQLPITPGKKLRSGDTLTKSIGKGVSNIQITDAYGARGGSHKGLDIAAPNGTYIALRYDCEVVAAGWYGDYGYTMDVWISQLGVQLRMAHLSAILIKTGKIPAGTSFARVGSTGKSSGPHIHFEYDTKKGRSNYGGSGDPSAYVNVLLLTNVPNRGSYAPVSLSTPQPQPSNLAVVSSQPSQVPSLPAQRRTPQVAVIDDRPPQVQYPNIPSGNTAPQMITVSPSKEIVLNNLIKNHILLDLAYT